MYLTMHKISGTLSYTAAYSGNPGLYMWVTLSKLTLAVTYEMQLKLITNEDHKVSTDNEMFQPNYGIYKLENDFWACLMCQPCWN
jgi:hypothetical protein